MSRGYEHCVTMHQALCILIKLEINQVPCTLGPSHYYSRVHACNYHNYNRHIPSNRSWDSTHSCPVAGEGVLFTRCSCEPVPAELVEGCVWNEDSDETPISVLVDKCPSADGESCVLIDWGGGLDGGGGRRGGTFFRFSWGILTDPHPTGDWRLLDDLRFLK